MSEEIRSSQISDLLDRLAAVLKYAMLTGNIPAGLDPEITSHPDIQEFIQQLNALQQFSLAMANGDLSPELKVKGKVAGALKSLQANLRHLTWQTQRIAEGDLTQKVDFMGEFSQAFNQMVERLRQSHQALEQRAVELAQQRQAALNLMHEAQAARQAVETANRHLMDQLDEIQSLQALLREQAIRDQLTGLFNRRYMEETIDREFARADRGKYPVGLIMLDIDRFKSFNDTYGHAAGDKVLKALGEMLRSGVRRGDIPCRYGGEEMVIIMPSASLQSSYQRAEQLRQAFEQLRVESGGRSLQGTFSAGVAVYPEHGKDGPELLRAADIALYASKSNGRNRVTISDANVPAI